MTKRPTIISASELVVKQRARPDASRCRPHKWLTPESMKVYEVQPIMDMPLYLSKLAEERIRNHAMSKVHERLEVMGLLLGSVYQDERGLYTVVRDVATTDLDASSVSVRFEKDGYDQLFAALDDTCFDYIIVGWYHSHPGHRCFLSETDVDTQRRMFNQPFHSAIVIDPINAEFETFCLRDEKVVVRPFAVFWDEYQNPYFGETVKTRQRRSDPNGVPLPQ